MAYTKTALKKQSLEAIEKHKLLFIDEIIAYLPCSKATFYNHKLEQLEELKSLLSSNRLKMKVKLKKKWYKSGNATLQIALYKLICNDVERRKISLNYNEHAGKGGESLFGKVNEAEAKKIAEKIAKANA